MGLPPWQVEVVELHEFFEGWLTGALPSTDQAYARLVDAVAREFLLISPGGERIPRERLLTELRAGHGSRPGWKMWVENAELRFRGAELVVATYEEWHRYADGTTTARLATAVFRVQAGAPNGLAWLHVQETWLRPG
jgi:hypothetical protein